MGAYPAIGLSGGVIDDVDVAGLVLQRWSLATLTVLLPIKTLENDWSGL